MALIAQAAYDNETLVEISSATTHKIAPTTQNPDGFTIRGEHRLCVTEDPSSPYLLSGGNRRKNRVSDQSREHAGHLRRQG